MIDWPEDLSDLQLRQDAEDARVHAVARQVGHLLTSGHLALFIGTGVSDVVRLPLWNELNRRIVEDAAAVLKDRFAAVWNASLESRLPSLDDLKSTGADALKVLDRVEEVCSSCESLVNDGVADSERFVGNAQSWHLLVRHALYRGRRMYEFDEMFHCELVSLCSLLTGGSRGGVHEVVTFNYDDLLQSYLRLHGRSYHVVTPRPNQLTPNDCTIFYHPHGYLPLNDTKFRDSPFLVLSKRSYERLASGTGEHVQLWRKLIAWLLNVRVGLFVGISGNDEVLKLYFDKALELGAGAGARRPLAFAVLVGGNYLSPAEWLKRRVVPLEFSNANVVAKFLALVCQQAADLTKRF